MKNFKDRRMVNDRRKFSYTDYSPERRSGQERRGAVNGNIKRVK